MSSENKKITMTVFTDPMMGLSYESEPIIDHLKEEYGERLELRYVMSLLVRDVSDFMTPEERVLEPEEGIRTYCRRLAGIYKSEETIGGLPINMNGFCLFDPEHRSSRPLCMAYKAARLADPVKADDFLTALRHAVVIDCLPATHFDVILKIIRNTGIDEAAFVQHYKDGTAEQALEQDLRLTRNLGIRSLPAYLLERDKKALILQSFHYQDFVNAIEDLKR